jgi:hypothetical protein
MKYVPHGIICPEQKMRSTFRKTFVKGLGDPDMAQSHWLIQKNYE